MIKHPPAGWLSRDPSGSQWVWNIPRAAGALSQLWDPPPARVWILSWHQPTEERDLLPSPSSRVLLLPAASAEEACWYTWFNQRTTASAQTPVPELALRPTVHIVPSQSHTCWCLAHRFTSDRFEWNENNDLYLVFFFSSSPTQDEGSNCSTLWWISVLFVVKIWCWKEHRAPQPAPPTSNFGNDLFCE